MKRCHGGKICTKSIICVIVTFILLLIVLLSCNNLILTKNSPVDSKILVIEGWLSAGNLEMIEKTFDLTQYETILITGVAHNHPEFLRNDTGNKLKRMPSKIFSNGCLCLGAEGVKKVQASGGAITEIKIFAYGSKALGRFPNIFVAINDSVIGNAFVNEKSSGYQFISKYPSSIIKDIFISFNNDLKLDEEDRNLVLDSISINGIVFNRPGDFSLINDYKVDNNLFTNYPFRSNAFLSATYLKVLGVKANILRLDTLFNKRNKTLISAKRLKSFFDANLKNVKAFNIVSVNGHSRRSYVAYKTIFPDKQIGIISLKDMSVENPARKNRWLRGVMSEYCKLFVTTVEYFFS
jgi:hypothetical protein